MEKVENIAKYILYLDKNTTRKKEWCFLYKTY